jgi:hypothetical protein
MGVFIGGVSELHHWFDAVTHQTLAGQPYTWSAGHHWFWASDTPWTDTDGDMGSIYRRWGGSPQQAWGGLEHLDGRPAIHVVGRPTFSTFTDFRHRRPTPLTPPWHVYETVFENMPNPSWLAKEVGSADPTLAWLGPGFVPCHPLVSYCLWQCHILDIMKICMD